MPAADLRAASDSVLQESCRALRAPETGVRGLRRSIAGYNLRQRITHIQHNYEISMTREVLWTQEGRMPDRVWAESAQMPDDD